MGKALHWILTIIICLLGIGSLYVCGALLIGSGFIFGDIDQTEAQRQAADVKRQILSVVCMIGFILSLVSIFLSAKIARYIVRFFE